MKTHSAILGVLCSVFLAGCPGGLLGAPSIEGTWKNIAHTIQNEYVADAEGGRYVETPIVTESIITYDKIEDGEGTFKYVETVSKPQAAEPADQQFEGYVIEGKYQLSNGVDWAQGVVDVIVTSIKEDSRVTIEVDGIPTVTHTLRSVPYDITVPIHGMYAFDSDNNLMLAWNEKYSAYNSYYGYGYAYGYGYNSYANSYHMNEDSITTYVRQ
jgi:hypothetical protein